MKSLLFFALLALAVSPAPARPNENPPTSIQSQLQQPLNESNKDWIRHGKKKRTRLAGRGKRKQKHGTARRFVEKQFLVQNRTLALLGEDVQRILHSTKTFNFESGRHLNKTRVYPERRKLKRTRKKQNGRKKTRILNINKNTSQTEEDDELFQKEYLDITSLKDDVQFNLNNAITRIISAIENFTSVHSEGTSCDKLADCKHKLQTIFLGPLPDCPCQYPTGIFYENKIWDESQKKFFRWKDASNERLDIYKLGAEYCIRSQIDHGSTSLSAQHCCYDRERKLLTRGSGAGSPNYISPDVSTVLHDKIDILPWRLCKGDFTRFSKVRPPNNGNLCEENPSEHEFKKQLQITISY